MNYRRKEAFRFTFDPPLECIFSIVEVDNVLVNSKNAEGNLIDISPNGAKLTTKLDIPLGTKKIKLKLTFKINSDTLYAVGVLVWKKEVQSGINYGVRFVNDSVLSDVIMEELKVYAKMKRST